MIIEILTSLGILLLLKKPAVVSPVTVPSDGSLVGKTPLPSDMPFQGLTSPSIKAEDEGMDLALYAAGRLASGMVGTGVVEIGIGLLGNVLSQEMETPVFSAMGSTAVQAGRVGMEGAKSIAESAVGIDVVGAMMAGQTDFTNPYSGYLSAIPGIGVFLGGLLEGIIGEGDPMAGDPTEPSYLAMLQRMHMDPRWGWQGKWKEEFDPTTKAGYGKETPKFSRPTNPDDLNWYLNSWSFFAAQAFSPYGIMTWMIGGQTYLYQDFIPSWVPPTNSPLSKWWEILKARDAKIGYFGEDVKIVKSKYYWTGVGPTVGEAEESGRLSYGGMNPFAELTDEDVVYFYQIGGVLDYIDILLSVLVSGNTASLYNEPISTITLK